MSQNPSWERSSSFFYCGPCSRLLFLSDYIRLSTTVAANALLEYKHALLITKGFKNLLLTGNQSRPKIFDLNIRHPSPLYSKVVEVVRGSSGEAVKISVSSSSVLHIKTSHWALRRWLSPPRDCPRPLLHISRPRKNHRFSRPISWVRLVSYLRVASKSSLPSPFSSCGNIGNDCTWYMGP